MVVSFIVSLLLRLMVLRQEVYLGLRSPTDCIFHELDQTYYVIDMICWRGYSLYDCTAEFRFFWLNSKLGETGACDPPSYYHKYRFSTVPIYNCDQSGLLSGSVPYVKDGLLFYNNYAPLPQL